MSISSRSTLIVALFLCGLSILSPSKAYAWCPDAVVNCRDGCWAQSGGTGTFPETITYCSSHGGLAPVDCNGNVGEYCTDRSVVTAGCSTTAVNTCTAGTLYDLTDTVNEYVWRCDGSGGGASATCSMSKPTSGWVSKGCGGSVTASFSCGAANTNFSCASNERLETRVYTTTCSGQTGWETTQAQCVADTSCVVRADAVCGASNGQSLGTAPSAASDLCKTGTSSTVSGTGPWSWTCNGVNGGASATCSAMYCPPPRDGVCDTSVVNGCSMGPFFDLADTATTYNWRCEGQNSGANADCSRPITPPPTSCTPGP